MAEKHPTAGRPPKDGDFISRPPPSQLITVKTDAQLRQMGESAARRVGPLAYLTCNLIQDVVQYRDALGWC